MTYRGKVKNGVVVLENPDALAEGTEVEIALVRQGGEGTWADALKEVIGKAEGLPADSSRNHGHYLYGTEKK